MGNGCSKSVVHFEDIRPTSAPNRAYRQYKQKNDEKFLLIWFTSDSSTPENLQRKNVFHSIINCFMIFQNSTEAEYYIKGQKNKKIFVIVHEDIGLSLLLSIRNLPQIAAIYFYCKAAQQYHLLLQPIPKVQCVTDDFDAMIKHLRKDLYAYEKLSYATFITTLGYAPDIPHIDQYHLKNYWPSLYDTDLTDDSRRILLETYTNYYNHNSTVTNILRRFQHDIGPSTAITWYTSEHVIYHLLNTVCETYNFHLLKKFQYLIRCIHIQLQYEHSSFIRHWPAKPILSIYCGRLMTKVQFKRLKMYLGQIIVMTNFLMGNIDKNKAVQQINRCVTSENEILVLFKINIDIHLTKTAPYTDITHLSNHLNENEVLIMFGACFRLMDVIISTHDAFPVCLLDLCVGTLDWMTISEREKRWFSTVESVDHSFRETST